MTCSRFLSAMPRRPYFSLMTSPCSVTRALALDGARRRAEHRDVRLAAAATDRAAAAVEQRQRDALRLDGVDEP